MKVEIKKDIYQEIHDLLHKARQNIISNVNYTMTKTYFLIGKRIVEEEQYGNKRAEYGKNLIKMLSEKLTKEFGKMLEEIFLINTSFHDLKAESVYHTFLLGMLIWLRDKYEVKSNGERGQGRYDILLLPLDKKKPAFIFEFKVSKTIKGLESKAREALNQIKEKQYDVGIKESGIDKIYRIGLAFKGKKVKIKYELA